MGRHFSQGFTIIETMLVLAITGVLISTLVVGTGNSINAERYKDSVTTFKSLLQDQYSMVDNVSNDRTTKGTCDASAKLVDNPAGVGPGQSNCVVMGRYLSIVNDQITASTVIGYPAPTPQLKTNDIDDLIANYTLGTSTDSIEKSSIEWGAAIGWPKTGVDASAANSRSLSVLVLRSPKSGTSYTFTSDTVYDPSTVASNDLLSMVSLSTTSLPGQKERYVCIDPGVGSVGIVPEKLAVYIGQAASDADAIETRSDSVTASLGGNTTCQ